MSNSFQSYSEKLGPSRVQAEKRDPVLVPNISWGSNNLFGNSNTDAEGREFSRLAVELLQVLYCEYPNPVAISQNNRSIVDTVQFNQIWNWLLNQHIVSGSPTSGALTGSGMRAFHLAIRQHPEGEGLRPSDGHAKQVGRASNVMLALLRAHVFKNVSRSVLT